VSGDVVVVVLVPVGHHLVIFLILPSDGLIERHELLRQLVIVVLGVKARVHVRAMLNMREISGSLEVALGIPINPQFFLIIDNLMLLLWPQFPHLVKRLQSHLGELFWKVVHSDVARTRFIELDSKRLVSVGDDSLDVLACAGAGWRFQTLKALKHFFYKLIIWIIF
jgi:hypothetical protein